MYDIEEKRIARFIAFYLLARTVIWALLLYITQPTLPMDVLEHLAWGREWQLVYAHHPGLPAWINESLNAATGGSHFALSAVSPVFVSLAMLAVWLLARKMVATMHAVAAMLMTEGIIYFNVVAVEFNHNIVQLTVCAWLFYLTYCAFLEQHKTSTIIRRFIVWFLLGAIAAISLYAKYSAALFLVPIFIWSVVNNQVRNHWRHWGPWLAMAVFVLLSMPQLLMLIDLNFAPLRFAAARAKEAQKWSHHIIYPLRFALAQLAAMLPALLVFASVIKKAGVKTATDEELLHRKESMQTAGGQFISIIAFAPLILALIISAIGGWRFRSMWGSSMLSFIPLWILMYFPSYRFQWKNFYAKVSLMITLTLLAVIIINVGTPHLKSRGKRVHYPGTEIGQYVEAQWDSAFNTPLRFVLGAKHIATLVSYYAPSRPSAIIAGDWKKSFWANADDFIRCGGVIVWTIDNGKKKDIPPPDYVKKYPQAQYVEPLSADWNTAADIPPVKIGLFLVPPTDTEC